MKTILHLLLIAVVGLLTAACASSPAPTATLAPESASKAAAANTQPTEDITLVGQTGRPQFLDSFAHW